MSNKISLLNGILLKINWNVYECFIMNWDNESKSILCLNAYKKLKVQMNKRVIIKWKIKKIFNEIRFYLNYIPLYNTFILFYLSY